MHEEASRHHVELFADVFTDQLQRLPALTTLTGYRFVAVDNAFQMRRQGVATGTFPLSGWFVDGIGQGRLRLLQLRFHRGQVGIPGFLEQVALFRGEGLVLWAKRMRR